MVGEVSTPPHEGPSKREIVTSKTVAAVAVAVLLIAFGLSNRKDVPVDWLVGTSHTPLILVILVSALLGAILGGAAVRKSSRKPRDPS
jgi:uncharacterized integral membrane protein